VNKSEVAFAANAGGGALQGFDGDGAAGGGDSVGLRAADVHASGQVGLGHAVIPAGLY
jgi:hypothetical protein